ncbi:glycoside hydrolase family 15 protein [Kitasatospora sp. NPDC088783]|uniref:glycoside hydrolase family 15 protein n=1 Tax=Kitasatospora sp. NPDC088783 TaxID=3364077 RepID=UPI0037FB3DD9
MPTATATATPDTTAVAACAAAGYQSVPLEDLVPLADGQTSVMLSTSGRVVYGAGQFGGPLHFAELLGTGDHGFWHLAPAGAQRADITYWDGKPQDASGIVHQEWTTPTGTVRITTFMPPRTPYNTAPSRLHQIVECLTGTVTLASVFAPRFEDGRLPGFAEILQRPGGQSALSLSSGPVTLTLDGLEHRQDAYGRWTAQAELPVGRQVALTLTVTGTWPAAAFGAPSPHADLAATRRDAQLWAERLNYTGAWQEPVRRSAALLRMLCTVSGSVAAALTSSLPEEIGGGRNWCYAASWLRDAAETIRALVRLGQLREAARWRTWLLRAVAGDVRRMTIMSRMDGSRTLTETEMPWLPGYENSQPVRRGNGAAEQIQHDVWGEVLEALISAESAGLAPDPAADQLMAELGEQIIRVWRTPDAGIWEVRGPQRHFTHSKLMCWQGLRLLGEWAHRRAAAGQPVVAEATATRWAAERDLIHADICANAWNPAAGPAGAFTQYYGGTELDAAVLLMARTGFLPPTDERLVATIEAIQHQLVDEAGFVRRYLPDPTGAVDGLTDDEGSFLACSYHLVEALAYLRRGDEARELFERLLTIRTPMGVISEMWDAKRRRLTGNLPQGFSLWALIFAALALDRLDADRDDADRLVALPVQRSAQPAATGEAVSAA